MTDLKYSACIELLFAKEEANLPSRISMAKDADLEGVEFWKWNGKDLDGIASALKATELPLTGMVAEPMIPITDPGNHDEFLAGLQSSVEVAQRLGCPILIAQTGDDLDGFTHAEQRSALISCLKRAADVLKGTGVTLAVEPLNTLIDHAGYFLSSTVEGLDIIDEVNRKEIRILYDIYHSAVMGEEISEVLSGRVDRIVHVHLADLQGRGEPGSGNLDYEGRLKWLQDEGYEGFIGLEYMPTKETVETLAFRDKINF